MAIRSVAFCMGDVMKDKKILQVINVNKDLNPCNIPKAAPLFSI